MTESAPQVFDRALLRRRRDRAAPRLDDHGFLFAETAARLVDRLHDVTRRFPLALDLGCRDGAVARALAAEAVPGYRGPAEAAPGQRGPAEAIPGQMGPAEGRPGGIDTLVQCDLSPAMAARAARHGPALVADEEWLPLAPASVDLVLCNLGLHWINDLPGALIQIRRALRPDGMLLASMLGGATLEELRACLSEAEIAEEGGLSPRFSPLADIRDLGDLLTRTGFVLPTVDAERITVRYADPLRLLADLRGMGESNAVHARRRHPLRRATLARALALYGERFGGSDGRVPATFEVITLTAWAPDAAVTAPSPEAGR